MKNLKSCIKQYISVIRSERNYSSNTCEAYKKDLLSFLEFLGLNQKDNVVPGSVQIVDVKNFLIYLSQKGYDPCSIERKISTLRSLIILTQTLVRSLMFLTLCCTNPLIS